MTWLLAEEIPDSLSVFVAACGVLQASGLLMENLLDRLRIEALQDIPNGGMGQGARGASTNLRQRSSGGYAP
jgi:hypothetical protein